MQFRHLRYFVNVVEAGSFSRAAAAIHVAQPALSQQIAELEERFGAPLLKRSARGAVPTPAGQRLYDEAVVILRQLEELPSLVRSNIAEPEGLVTLGIASTLAPKLLGRIVAACRETLPKVNLRLSDADSESLSREVHDNALHMGIVLETGFDAQVARKPLYRQQLHVIGSTPLGKKKKLPLADVAKLPLVLPPAGVARRDLVDQAMKAAGLRADIILEANSVLTELATVRAGAGYTILPTGDLSNYPAGAFSTPMPLDPPLEMTCSLVVSSDFPLTVAGEAVRDIVASAVEAFVRETKPPGAVWISV
ncbi:HTH-type transcriptional regulator CynR [Variibacter gotjawalensis]|uniref:HTH-type transcriptional regulator CynR n=1 Tax=Variibacter gotjawalensis TaxID=1333996 RepID=A0A0S3PUB7_9BRAD|nr:LysR substrate-binding domain-containing protein [Variibacter gotjawalensis]NIK49807.1 LysR family nitrogen assimilation transcriptional regulator [Variibacter gotjawalensis]RZS45811.1 LysR family nitrogen assimilation transcriptional regulator [Variibacter gotjawalensis]BAT59484.1 HTH-type transcriptional regulator CynR [Variibacter gotjawalensis]